MRRHSSPLPIFRLSSLLLVTGLLLSNLGLRVSTAEAQDTGSDTPIPAASTPTAESAAEPLPTQTAAEAPTTQPLPTETSIEPPPTEPLPTQAPTETLPTETAAVPPPTEAPTQPLPTQATVEPLPTETVVEPTPAGAPTPSLPSAALVPSGTARFGIIGDYAEGPDLLAVSNQIKSWSPDFIVTVGDNTYSDLYGESLDDDVGQYFHSFIYPYVGGYGQGATTNMFWPILGNHDWVVINDYLSYFSLPGNERYYEFARGPVDFFMLDSDTHEPDGYRQTSAQAAWFHSAIAASPYPWKLVLLHNPPYSSGSSFGSNTAVQWPFKSWGATAVFSGHNHVYERIVPPTQGILFFVDGLGGSDIGTFNSSQVAGEQFRYNDDFGAMRVDATMSTIAFQFRREDGVLIDSASLSRPTISGNAGVAGATLGYTDLGGPQSVTADGSGNYSIPVSYNWSGAVTPSEAGYTFTPPSRTYTNVLANALSQNYAATATTFTISGNAGVGGATLSYTGGSTTANVITGAYSFTVSSGWSGTVTPSRPGYTFTPPSRSYTNVTSNQTGQDYAAHRAPADFAGNGTSDIVVYRGGAWLFHDFATATYTTGVWTGDPGGSCIPAPMDYDGDGAVEFTQLCGNAWHFYNNDGSYNKGIWIGIPGALPVPADYNGDGTDDVVVFDNGAWQFYNFATGLYDAAHSVWTGNPPTWPGGTSRPVPMDYNGDGKADFTIYAGGPWHFYNSNGSYNKGIWTGGAAGDVPVPGDYNGDGTDDVVVFSGGAWQFFSFATGAYLPGSSVWTGDPPHWLGGTSLPAPLDFNGDGKMDFTVFSGGPWHFYNADGSYNKGIWTGGVAGDMAISRRQLP